MIKLSYNDIGPWSVEMKPWHVDNFEQLAGYFTRPQIGPKEGSYFVRGEALPGATRKDGSIPSSHLIIIDADKSLSGAPGAPGVDTAHGALAALGWSHFIYTTYSHTDEFPRYRIVLPVPNGGVDHGLAGGATQFVVSNLQLCGVPLYFSTESIVISQPWFFPRLVSGGSPFEFRYHAGAPLPWHSVTPIRVHFRTDAGATAVHVATDEQTIAEARAWGRAQPGGAQGERNNALFRLVATLRERYGVVDAVAYDIALEWASRCSPPMGEGEVWGRVRSAYGGNAQSAQGGRHPAAVFGMDETETFTPANTVSSIPDLIGDAITILQAACDSAEMGDHGAPFQEEVLQAARVLKRGNEAEYYKWRGVIKASRSIPIGEWEKAVARGEGQSVTREISGAAVDRPMPHNVAQYDLTHGMVMVGGKTCVVRRYRDLDSGNITDELSAVGSQREFYSNQIAADEHGNPINYGTTESPKHRNIFDVWARHKDRRSYKSVFFRPDPTIFAEDNLLLPDTCNALNMWRGYQYKPIAGDCGLILHHIWDVWCSRRPELYDYVIKWFAHLVQRPFELPEVALVLPSIEGTGKDTIMRIFTLLLGQHAVSPTSQTQISGRFNEHLAKAVLIFANEATWGGNRAEEGVVRSMITDPTKVVEGKNMPIITVPNYSRLVYSSNSDWVTSMTITDRRHVFFPVSPHKAGDFEYFRQLRQHIDGGGKEAFIYHLMYEIDINQWNPRVLPIHQSEKRLHHILKSGDEVIRWWHEVLTEVSFNGFENPQWWDSELWVSTQMIDESYRLYCQRNNIRYPKNKSELIKKIHELFSGTILKAQRASGTGRTRGQVFANLYHCRAMFERAVKMVGAVDWDE